MADPKEALKNLVSKFKKTQVIMPESAKKIEKTLKAATRTAKTPSK